MKKNVSITIICIGAVLFLIGLFIKIPSEELTTHLSLGDKYSLIEEYVGGDAYNYIIGASIVSGKIVAAKIEKAIYISFGLLIIALGLILFTSSMKALGATDKSYKLSGEDETITDIEKNLPEI